MNMTDYDRKWKEEYDKRYRTPHYCDGTLGFIKKRHKIAKMFHAGNTPSGRHELPRFRCGVCSFTGFSSVKRPKRR